ncbi:MAG: HAD family hydrolase [Deltaproteobacteria bacterium]|nr:HAD family hydrolase [Myxococcales bacterium]MDP3216133.1 HAD family hydrolase [Deltaproteobacteria bacterium]
MNHPLQTILDEIDARHRAGERPVVIFDLDGTLYDNRPRTIRIVHALAAALPPECDRDAAIIRALGPGDLRYRLDDTLRPLGVSEDVITLAKERWFRRFFTDTACADDVPVRGAAPFVQRCFHRGATVVYLTGRDIPGMLVGTVRTLRDDGFPIGQPRVELVLKPTFEEDDTGFKRRMLDPMSELGTIVATFENEPGNCNLFHHRWPASHSVLIETQFAPGAPDLEPGCLRVPDFSL